MYHVLDSRENCFLIPIVLRARGHKFICMAAVMTQLLQKAKALSTQLLQKTLIVSLYRELRPAGISVYDSDTWNGIMEGRHLFVIGYAEESSSNKSEDS